MSAPVEILTELQRRGVSIAAEGDTLCLKPKRVLDEALLARIREAKPEILEALRSRFLHTAGSGAICGSTECAGCYNVGDDRKIHPPKCSENYRKWLERWQPKGKPQ